MTKEGAPSDVPTPPVAAASLYRLAYEHALRTLDDQRDELNGVRGRAGQFMAFVGSATAFLVGAGLQSPNRDHAFYVSAILGSVLVLAALTSLSCVLSPLWKFDLTLDPGTLVEKWIERQVPRPPTEADLLRELSKRIAGMISHNDSKLTRIRGYYLATVLLGTLGLLDWAVLVWMHA